MIITDFNKMTLEELFIINKVFNYEYCINDGLITSSERRKDINE